MTTRGIWDNSVALGNAYSIIQHVVGLPLENCLRISVPCIGKIRRFNSRETKGPKRGSEKCSKWNLKFAFDRVSAKTNLSLSITLLGYEEQLCRLKEQQCSRQPLLDERVSYLFSVAKRIILLYSFSNYELSSKLEFQTREFIQALYTTNKSNPFPLEARLISGS